MNSDSVKVQSSELPNGWYVGSDKTWNVFEAATKAQVRETALEQFNRLVNRGVLNPCAWCDKENGVVSRPSGTSHGICEIHASELLAEIGGVL